MNGGIPTDAKADSITTMPAIGIALASNQVLISGIYTPGGTPYTAGAVYYVSEIDGTPTNIQPSTSTNIVQRIGVAISTSQLLIQLSLDEVTVA